MQQSVAMPNRMRIAALVAALVCYLLSLVLVAPLPALAAVSPDGWGTQSSGTGATLRDVWGTSASDMYACGVDGTILHYDGIAWTSMSSNTTGDLYSLWGASSDDIFAVGESGIVIHYDGIAWSPMGKPPTGHLNAVWGSAPDNVFAVGNGGIILKYDGAVWNAVSSGTTTHLSDVWGSAADDVFAAGNNGLVLNYDGMVWTEVASGHPNVAGIWGSAPDDVFAVGNGGTVIHFDGTLPWTEVTETGTSENLYSVWGTSSSDVFAVGNAGTILHYNGIEWTAMNSGTANDLQGVWGDGPVSVFVVGQMGTILHYQDLAPIITSVTPGDGNQGETLSVAISGAKLDGATDIDFGAGITIDNYTVASSLITVSITISAAAVTGPRDVLVTNADGTGVLAGGFSVPHATVTELSPDTGKQGQTLDVVIAGKNLGGTTAVTFGNGITTTGFVVDGPGQITASIAIAASAISGPRDVSVITPGSTPTLYGGFSVPGPAIAAVTPDSGNQGRDLSLIVTGTNLHGTAAVSLGDGIAIAGFVVDSPDQITVEISISSDAAPGPRIMTVTASGVSASLNDAFSVLAASGVSSVSPGSGRQGDTLDVVITGSHLEGTTAVSFGAGIDALGIGVNSIRVDGPTRLTVNVSIDANANLELRDVVVVTPLGLATLEDGFTVERAAPTISSIEPGSGHQGATLNVLVRGTNLLGTESVSFGPGVTVNSFTLISFTTMRVNIGIAADAEPGSRDASVTNQTATFTLPGAFIIEEAAGGQVSLWVFVASGLGAGLLSLLFILAFVRKRRKPAEQGSRP
jgi:hypothetical protein